MAKSALIVAVVLFAIAGPTHGMETADQVTIQLNEVKVATDGYEAWACADPVNEKECRGISAGATFTGTCTCHQSATQVEQQAKKRACAEAHGTTVEALEADNSKWAGGECQAAVCGNSGLSEPAGYTCVDGSSNTRCFKKHATTANMHLALKTCWEEGARVCTFADMRKLCGATVDGVAVNPYSGGDSGWYGDHGTKVGGDWDDEYGTWNRAECQPDGNEDGEPKDSTEELLSGFVCCRGGEGGSDSTLHADLRVMHSASYDVGASEMQDAMPIGDANKVCKVKNAHVCTHNDMYALATGKDNDGAFFNPWSSEGCSDATGTCAGKGWYGDHGKAAFDGDWDDEFGTWNRDSTASAPDPTTSDGLWLNNDGRAKHWHEDVKYQFRCCGYPHYTECPEDYILAGDVCYKKMSEKKMYHSSEDDLSVTGAMAQCQQESGAYVCTFNELQRICSHDGHLPMQFNGETNGWFGDHGFHDGQWDDRFGTWNDGGGAGGGPACDVNADSTPATAHWSQGVKRVYTCCVNPTP